MCFAFFFIFLFALSLNTSFALTIDVVKWTPGYYCSITNAKDDPVFTTNFYYDLQNTPEIIGVYDFPRIDNHLVELTTIKKRLVIQIKQKSFDNVVFVPNYILQGAIYSGGVISYSDVGNNTPSEKLLYGNPSGEMDAKYPGRYISCIN